MELSDLFPKILKVILILINISFHTSNADWQWKCTSGFCTRIPKTPQEQTKVYPSVELCRMICNSHNGLWPQPMFIRDDEHDYVITNINEFKTTFTSSNTDDIKNYIAEVVDIFKENTFPEKNKCLNNSTITKIELKFDIQSDVENLLYSTDETYSLILKKSNENQMIATINSKTIFGARHALETLTQLAVPFNMENYKTCIAMHGGITIKDKPFYRHRGLLLDTSRNFLSVKNIKKHIDAMGASKMNVLHWHITDSQSFGFNSRRVPNMAIYGAYSPKQVFTMAQIKALKEYARLRGVRILMEIDAPAHSGQGWQWGPSKNLGNLSLCINKQPWRSYCMQPPCGQLNPINPNVYTILEKIYADIIEIFPESDIFHMGGDELNKECWISNKEIVNYLRKQKEQVTNGTFIKLWKLFQTKALKSYDAAAKHNDVKIILWTSALTDPETNINAYLPTKRYIIQTWVPSGDKTPELLTKKGYDLIISTKDAWYLDHGFWHPTLYYDWMEVYSNRILETSNVLGGEVCMWGEYVDGNTVEGRVWPRAAAAAERLWSNPKPNKKTEVAPRFYQHRKRLVSRGIRADMITPEWCYQNDGQCD